MKVRAWMLVDEGSTQVVLRCMWCGHVTAQGKAADLPTHCHACHEQIGPQDQEALTKRLAALEAEVKRLREPCDRCGQPIDHADDAIPYLTGKAGVIPPAPEPPRTGAEVAERMREVWPGEWEPETGYCGAILRVHRAEPDGAFPIDLRVSYSSAAGWRGWVGTDGAGVLCRTGDPIEDFGTFVSALRAAHARLLTDLGTLGPKPNKPAPASDIVVAERAVALLDEILSRFWQKGHPGTPCLRTGWQPEADVKAWRAEANRLHAAVAKACSR